MIDRRTFIGRVAGALAALPLLAHAQPAVRVYRLGYLSLWRRAGTDVGFPIWVQMHLRELGYVEGRNLHVEARFAEGQSDRLPGLARELAELKPDVILAIGTSAIQASKLATTTIPIVFLTNVDPVAAGLVPSLGQAGGNVTGILIAPEGTLAGKKLELLRELVPSATRIGVLAPDDSGLGFRLQLVEIRKAAASLGVELVVAVATGGDYPGAFATISAARPAALFVGAHSRFVNDRNQIIALAAKHRLPAIYEWPQQVRDGGLMSYGASDTETYRRVAIYVDRILKGARPTELPIEQPSKLLLVINLKTAKALGLRVPQSLRVRADEVIE